jgi:Protein of unknown function (DUF998)
MSDTDTRTTTRSPGTGASTEAPRAFGRGVRRLGGLGVAGAGIFASVVLALHVVEPELTPHDHFASEYVLTDTGPVMKVAFLVLGAGVLFLALGLRASLEAGRRTRWGWGLLAAAAAGLAAGGVFDTDPVELVGAGADPSWHGMLHDLSGMVAFAATIAATLVLRGPFTRSPGWQPMGRMALLFGSGLAALLVVMVAAPTDAVGVAQRPFLVVLLLWFGILGTWMLHRTAGPEGTEVAAADLVRAATTRVLAAIGIGGALTFATAVVAVGVLAPGLSLSENFVSDYALADGGLLLTVGFLAVGAAHVAVGLGLRRSLSPSRRRAYVSWALVAIGVGSVLSGLFPSLLWTDPATGEPGWHQTVHEVSGLLSLPVVLSVLVVLGGAYRRDPRWRPLTGIHRLFTVAFVVLLVAFLAVPDSEIGVAQRSHQAVMVTWFAVTSLYLSWVSRSQVPVPATGSTS